MYVHRKAVFHEPDGLVQDLLSECPGIGNDGRPDLREAPGVLEIHLGAGNAEFPLKPGFHAGHDGPLVLDARGFGQLHDQQKHRYNHVPTILPRGRILDTPLDHGYCAEI